MARRPTVDSTTLELAEAKLLSSGIDLATAERLGIEVLGPAATQKLGAWAKALPALLIPYFGPDGLPMTAWPGHPPFYRLRYLAQPTNDTGIQTEPDKKKKPLRYVQPPGSAVAAYLPRTGEDDWLELMADAEMPLVITEGEFKAACACLYGFPCIGLGGVQNWRALNKGIIFLPELEAINWVARAVYICFDSDYKSNPQVLDALVALANELMRRGAYPLLVSIPQVDDKKVGLDDFIVVEGAEAFQDLLHASEPLGLTQPLFDLNARYTYVRSPGLLLDRKLNERLSPNAFKEHAESTKLYQERVVRGNGAISREVVSAAGAWLSWPLRDEVDRMTYRPGCVGRVVEPNGQVAWSTWPGWGAEPSATSSDAKVKPFLTLLNHLFAGAEPEAIKWFIRWCAYPIKYPSTKLFSCVLLWGRRHGTGKSLVGYTLGKIYGRNFTEVKSANLHETHNEWAEGKQFILGDDITGSDKRQDADMLKKLITQQEIRINIKYVPSFTLPDYINWYFTSNQPDAFFLDDDDRRNFIHEVLAEPLDEEFYVDYGLWLETGGASLLHRWLLNVDLGDFNPAAPAYRTAAKERMIADSRSDLASWVRQLLAAPEGVLRVGEQPIVKDLFTNRELLALYDPSGQTRTTANGLGRELKRAGAHQVLEGAPVKLPDGGQDRLYIVRNPARWSTAATADVTKHLETWLKRQRGGVERKF